MWMSIQWWKSFWPLSNQKNIIQSGLFDIGSRWKSKKIKSSPPTTNTHTHTHNTYMWSNSHRKTLVQPRLYEKSTWYQTWICAPRRDHRKEGDYTGRVPSWRVSSLSHIFSAPNLRSDTEKTSPLSWFENQWDYQEKHKKCRFYSWRECTLLLTPETRHRKCIETAWDSGQFLPAALVCASTWAELLFWPCWLHGAALH